MNKFKIENTSVGELNEVFGMSEEHLQLLEKHFGVEMVLRGDELHIFGDQTVRDKVFEVVVTLRQLYQKGQHIASHDVTYLLRASEETEPLRKLTQVMDARSEIGKTGKGKPIYAKTINQREYVAQIQKNDLVFGIGPAGCGKTYLAVVLGIMMMRRGAVERIVITRPVVEAGESLGFLPGDLKEKVDPYLRPLYDAFHEVLGAEMTEKMTARGQIEIAPLAYMRGRTLEHAYVVLDEAQNTTKEQMKMFLTRLGDHSKMVVTGDVTQIDLPRRLTSGLVHASNILEGVDGIAFVKFETVDVVRHPLVQKVIERYMSVDQVDHDDQGNLKRNKRQ